MGKKTQAAQAIAAAALDPLLREIEFHLTWLGSFHGPTLRAGMDLAKNRLTDAQKQYAGLAAAAAGLVPDAFWTDGKLRKSGWYIAPPTFRPVLSPPSVPDFLIRLARAHGLLAPGMDDPKTLPPPWQPLAGALPELDRRAIPFDILRAVVRAMIPDPTRPPRARAGEEGGDEAWDLSGRRWQRLDISYLGSGGTRRLQVVPHAFTHDTFRWAARCLVTEAEGRRQAYRDVVLDRILEVHGAHDTEEDPARGDADWNTEVPVELVPRRGLSAADEARVATQYGMRRLRGGGPGLVVWMRRCFVVYFLKRLQLETDLISVRDEVRIPPTGPGDAFDLPGRAPHQQPLAIANTGAVRGWIPKPMRIPPE